jgi:hypothetical protein
MREIHVVVKVPQDRVPEGFKDIHVSHEPASHYEGSDPGATRFTSTDANTTVFIHWYDGLPKDKEVQAHATDAVLRSLGL